MPYMGKNRRGEDLGFDLIRRCHSITFDLIYNDNMTKRRRKFFRKITEILSVNKGNTGRERKRETNNSGHVTIAAKER